VVDLTLIAGNGEKLLMPPNFEDSSERTGHDYEDLSEDATRNRDLLREVIKSHGFERFKLSNLPLENVP
jgi:D-alanyl-D-alanine dipeptidase